MVNLKMQIFRNFGNVVGNTLILQFQCLGELFQGFFFWQIFAHVLWSKVFIIYYGYFQANIARSRESRTINFYGMNFNIYIFSILFCCPLLLEWLIIHPAMPTGVRVGSRWYLIRPGWPQQTVLRLALNSWLPVSTSWMLRLQMWTTVPFQCASPGNNWNTHHYLI